jgi:flagellar basal body-associated protein FliL
MNITIFEFIIAAIGIVIAIVLVIALAACAIAPLMMGKDNKSIVDTASTTKNANASKKETSK